ncbi:MULTISPECIES: site-specific integrase [Bacteria]|uniref:site-specific integrase n=5 Tax=cellular organisms TaxID=131567 RepID=UPI00248C5B81|nr:MULTISPECIES: site-specific integrase [Bacteria]
MELQFLKEGVVNLLKANFFSPRTISNYEQIWGKFSKFLQEEYGNQEVTSERGLNFLTSQYPGVSQYLRTGKFNRHSEEIFAWRAVHLLEDFSQHGVLIRYRQGRRPIELKEPFESIFKKYKEFLESSSLSPFTQAEYEKFTKHFLDFCGQKGVPSVAGINLETFTKFLETSKGQSPNTIAQKVTSIKSFLKFSYHIGSHPKDLTSLLTCPKVSRTAAIPSSWSKEDLKKLLSVIDRNSPNGKRDYAMVLAAAVLGLRISDLRNLSFDNFDWKKRQLHLIQHKTKKPLTLPLPDVVGWAVIDYIKNGRPKVNETKTVFIKHRPPFNSFADSNNLRANIQRYLIKAGVQEKRTGLPTGFHSFRHSAASILLEEGTPLPVITQILGHSNPNVTAIYLKTDLNKLRECALDPEEIFL